MAKLWTDREAQILVDVFENGGDADDAHRLMPHRTIAAIKHRACRLGIEYRRRQDQTIYTTVMASVATKAKPNWEQALNGRRFQDVKVKPLQAMGVPAW